jgi:hypothetical protein
VFPVEIVTVVSALAVEVTLTEGGAKMHVAPVGSPVHERLTTPLKPLLGARLTIAETLDPELTLKALVDELMAKVPDPDVAATAEIEPNKPSFSLFSPAAK